MVFDPSFGTCVQAVAALRDRVISARELTEHCFSRIKRCEPAINAFVTLAEEQASQSAAAADEALAANRSLGPLHGLPIMIKDQFATAGIRTTSGSKILKKYTPPYDAVAVGRLREAGAIILGKTNLPEFAWDHQTYNEVAGATNNPWDATKTPGGSTGGGAAALAAGLGFLELGSDVGGSIRNPAHFCGIYGLKPTLELVPTDGSFPSPLGRSGLRRAQLIDLPVAGPMARSAEDLKIALMTIAGPPPTDSVAYQWRLPPPRQTRLSDYRIGYLLDDPFCPVSSEVRAPLETAISLLREQGVKLVEGWPKGISAMAAYENYYRLLAGFSSLDARHYVTTPAFLEAAEGSHYHAEAKLWDEGLRLSHREWLDQNSLRMRSRLMWQQYFEEFDAFLMPTSFTAAFAHDPITPGSGVTFWERTIDTGDGPRSYHELNRWISMATLTGCPAVTAPVGKTADGLPVGIQIMGPYLEDGTPIDLAVRMAELMGGFDAPPGFVGR